MLVAKLFNCENILGRVRVAVAAAVAVVVVVAMAVWLKQGGLGLWAIYLPVHSSTLSTFRYEGEWKSVSSLVSLVFVHQ